MSSFFNAYRLAGNRQSYFGFNCLAPDTITLWNRLLIAVGVFKSLLSSEKRKWTSPRLPRTTPTSCPTRLATLVKNCSKIFWKNGKKAMSSSTWSKQGSLLSQRRALVSLTDVERFNSTLAQMICDEYYRVYPFVCAALKNYVNDRADITIEKVIFFFKFSSKNLVLVNRNSIK